MCNISVIKVFFLLINIIFFSCGLSLTVLAVIGKNQLMVVSNAFETGFNLPTDLVLIVGVFIMIIALFGIVAVIIGNRCVLVTFGLLLVLILLLQFVAAVMIFVFKTQLLGNFQSYMVNSFKTAYKNDTNKEGFSTTYFNNIQKKFKCCGIFNATDYETYNKTIPESCCANLRNCSIETAYGKGCLEPARNEVGNRLVMLALVDIIFCFVNLLQIIFTFCMVRSVEGYIRV